MTPFSRLSGVYDIKAVERVAHKLGKLLQPGDIITLTGEVGAGKTTFARALIHAISAEKEVTSPTFNLMQSYPITTADSKACLLWHLDLYRLKNREEAYPLGLDELWNQIVLIEWPEIIEDILPKCRLAISFEFGDNPDTRNLILFGDETWQNRLENIK